MMNEIPETEEPTVLDENTQQLFPVMPRQDQPADYDTANIFFKGNGKGGKGQRRGGNPVGKDGRKLTCSICGSGK